MICLYRDGGGARGQRPAALRKLVTTVFAVACMVGSAMAWDWDAASVRIVAPAPSPPGNNIDSGTVVAPIAVVRNLGDSTASFPVLFSITPDYVDTVEVDSLVSGDSIVLTFSDWTAHQRGSTTAACSTALVADESTANDRISRNFNVRVRDVSVDSIVAPVDTIYYAQTVTPQAWVTNHGTGNANFIAVFRIAASYSDSQFVFLASGATQVVNFTNWTPDTLGTIALACTAAMTSDTLVVDNNLAQDSCFVKIFPEDAGVMRIVSPSGIVDSGAVKAPQAMVRNYGSNTISFPAIFTIGSSYADTQQVTDLPSLDSLVVTFADWTASTLGTFVTRCSTALPGDPESSNDMRSDSVRVIIRTTDAGVVRIIAPPDTVDSSGGAVIPVALVRNYGLAAVSFPVLMRIGFFMPYADTQQVTDLPAGDSLVVSFAGWTVPRRGLTTAVCSTMVTGDQDVSNDKVTKYVFRRVRNVGALSISAPVGVVPFDTVVTPTARLQNLGNTTDSFPVIFRIGTFYEDTARTNDSVVAFRPCTLNVAGTFSTQCSTAMVDDVLPTNDAVFDSVQVMPAGISAADPATAIPRSVTLSGNGPFAGRVAIIYGLPRAADMRLEVYDACGRLVRVIVAGTGQPGYHTAVWQCADERGRAVPQGAYFVRLKADDVTLTSKVVKLE